MSNDTKITAQALKPSFTAPATAQECSMEDLAHHGFASEPQPVSQEQREPRPLSPGSTFGE